MGRIPEATCQVLMIAHMELFHGIGDIPLFKGLVHEVGECKAEDLTTNGNSKLIGPGI